MNVIKAIRTAASSKGTVPQISSAEISECGLACLAMVSRFHGHDVTLNVLRQRFPVALAGLTLRQIATIADELGFRSRALRVEVEHLRHAALPAVLHWDFKHYVVLAGVSGDRFVVHDPARGARSYSAAEVSKHFTGVLLELAPSGDFSPIKARASLGIRQLWTVVHGAAQSVGLIMLLSLALQILAFAAPIQVQLAIDQAVVHGDLDLLNLLTIVFSLLLVLAVMLEACRNWTVQLFGNLFSYQVIGNIVRHLLRLPVSFFEKRHIGDILSRIGSTTVIQDALSKGLISALLDGLMASAAMALLLIYSIPLGLIAIAASAVAIASSAIMLSTIRNKTEEQLVNSAAERTYLIESIRSAQLIKLMGCEIERENTWRNLFSRVVNTTLQVSTRQLTLKSFNDLVHGASAIAILYLGARQVIAGHGMSIGMLVAFLAFRGMFAERMKTFTEQLLQLRLLGLHLDRLADIVQSEPDAGGSSSTEDLKGAISLRNVSFRYGSADDWVLRDVDLEIAPGDFVAFVGPSGGGKTTLFKILLGLYQPTGGEILIDGKPATPARWRQFRQRVGAIMQEDQLLSGTIADNIAFFDNSLNMERVRQVAADAAVSDEINRQPLGYLSPVGELGSTLSGGQRQRVLLARALYRDPLLLFMDEGTANLDETSETQIADLVERMTVTRIVVAHRPALVRRAQRIFEVQGGQVRESTLRERNNRTREAV